MASLRASAEGRLLRLTLDRAERRNALNHELCLELVRAVGEAEANEGVGAILIDAEGPVFCAGMDLDESLETDAVERTAIHEELFTLGARASKPIVAVVQGGAVAGGVGLVAQAHVALCESGATFRLPEVQIGMWPFVIWASIAAAMGERRALALSLTGEKFGAAEACEYGLVHRVVSAERLAEEAGAVARAMAEGPAGAIGRGMKLARESREVGLEETVALATGLRAEQLQSTEYRDTVGALRAKRNR
jgi:enoyl-CoA hydratase/carnithine racemase